MIEIFKTVNNGIVRAESFDEGAWVNLVNPNEEEIRKVNKFCSSGNGKYSK